MANELHIDILCTKVWVDEKGKSLISTRRYRQLADEGKVPVLVSGQTDALKASGALLAYYYKLAHSAGSLSLTDERTRLTRINADRKELELQKERGQLIDTALAIREWSQVVTNLASRMDAVESKLKPLVPVEFHDVLNRIIDEAKNECSNPDFHRKHHRKNMGVGNRAGIKSHKAQAAVKHKRVGKQ
jgi:phage terminase Nu1 subunit (DNA packaging protein)